jgi:ABC-type multidrug transport system ATPase subunit
MNALASAPPARRPDVALGPALLRGPAPVHVVKDPRTGRRYEMGVREHFVLSRLDGVSTLEQIGAAYAAEFGRRLGDGAWGQLLGLFAARGLLDTGPDRDRAPGQAPRAPGQAAMPVPPRGLLRGEIVLGHPSGLIHGLARRLSPVLRPAVLVPLAIALAAADIALLTRLPALGGRAAQLYHQPSLIVGVFMLAWGAMLLHELAHGLAAVRFGGDALRIGLRWRLPIIAFYCATEDVELFPARRRMVTAAAGVFADLAAAAPLIALWLWLPAHDPTRDAVAALLILINWRIVFNLLPVPPLDGYLIVSHALGASRLAGSSLRYTGLLIRRDEARRRYPRRAALAYLGYTTLLAVTIAAIMTGFVLVLLAETSARYTAAGTSALALLAVTRLVGLRFRARKLAAAAVAAGPIIEAAQPEPGQHSLEPGQHSLEPGQHSLEPSQHSLEEARVPPSPTTTPPAIVVEGVSKAYGSVQACRDISLTVVRGEMFGLLGPNGAGKTTLIEIIEGLRRPDRGQVTVLGRAPWPRDPRFGLRIGVQTQASAFFTRLTAREHLETVAALYGLDRDTARRTADRFGIDGWADTRVDRLSGGQRQRLAIASALVHDPDLLFLDEPTAALDPQARRDLWRLLREIRDQGKTIVYTTHHLDEAEALCDRVAIITDGTVVTCGRPRDLIAALDEPIRVLIPDGRITLGQARALAGVDNAATEDGCVVLATRAPALVLSAVAGLAGADGLRTRTATLEDVYLKLTGTEYRP